MSAADAIADRIADGWLLVIVVALMGIASAVTALVVDRRRKWPHGKHRVCGLLGCECERSLAAMLKRRGQL